MSSSRAAVAELELVAEASAHLTRDVAMHLPFEALGPFKNHLKRYFSHQPWGAEDARALSELVAPYLAEGRWEHDLGHGLTLAHGMSDGGYLIAVLGEPTTGASVWDRVFAGPVLPEQTPHPRKVKFTIGGSPAPGRWHRRGEEIDDERVVALLADDEISDVMVAGDFVTVGLVRGASWEERLDEITERVTDLFHEAGTAAVDPERTREELMSEAGGLSVTPTRPEDLHLMNPERDEDRALLVTALDADDPRLRRAAVATLSLSTDPDVAKAALVTGYRDDSRLVRRTAIDAASDLEVEEYRPLFEEALDDSDPWTRWKAVRALAELGIEPSREAVILLAADEDFRVRFEVAAVLRDHL